MRLLTICTTNSINFLRAIQRNVQRCPARRVRHREAGRRMRTSVCPISIERESTHHSPTISPPADWHHFLFVTVHFAVTLHMSMSHNFTAPSSLPLTTFFPPGDNAIMYTSLSPSLQSSHIRFPLSKFHIRSEPASYEPVMIRCPSGRCMTL
jgi:hypothetical protein